MNTVASNPSPGKLALVACLAMILCGVFAPIEAPGQSADRLVTEQEAARFGLRRAWYSQADVDPGRSRIVQLTLDKDLLLILTDQALIHAFDAQSGATRWTTQVGNPNYPSLGPAANEQFVALVNGSTLYLLDRITGTPVSQQSLGGGPGGGPALSKTYVFAPLVSGVVRAFALDTLHESRTAWSYPSAGRTITQPVVSDASVFWPTDRGYLYVASANQPQMRFRLETQREIIAKPGYRRPMIFVGSLDGYVYAVHETTGDQLWKFSVGDPIVVSPAAIEDHVFVCSQAPRMHCLQAEDGVELWRAAPVERFVAASPDRVYGMDRWSTLYILDRASGVQIGRINFEGSTVPLVNQQTDRLYLATPTGLIQCLHEIGIPSPIHYEPPPVPEDLDATDGEAAPTTPAPGAATLPADDPFATPDADDDPFASPDDDDDPFNQ